MSIDALGTTLTREQLYEQVWSTPMRHLAKQYGLSDVGLAKICKKHDIPTPTLGYWAKLRAGKPVKQPGLPNVDGEPVEIRIWKSPKHKPEDAEPPSLVKDPELVALIAAEREPENRIVVQKVLRAPHSLVIEAKDMIGEAGRARDPGRWSQPIDVSGASRSRALQILDALARGFDHRGYTASIQDAVAIQVHALGEVFGLRIFERFRRVAMRDDEPYYRKAEHEPSGILELQLLAETGSLRKSLCDGKRRSLEERLNEFLIHLIVQVEAVREHRKWLADWEAARGAKRQRQLEDEERRRRDEAKRRQLESQASAWVTARQIREYAAAAREKAFRETRDIAEGTEFGAWYAYAITIADEIDPLVVNESR